MGAKCLMKRVSEQEMVCGKYESFDWKKIDNCGSTERKSGSGRPRSLRTAANVSMIQDMMCNQDDAPCSHINPRKTQEHIEHCNLAWILFIKLITVTFVVADGPLTSLIKHVRQY